MNVKSLTPWLTSALTLAVIAGFPGLAAACPVSFSYDSTGSPATTVYISGTFNDWASEPPDVWIMTDGNNDQIWELDADLAIDTYLYKFIVDGIWITDPANPETDPDGYGGYNSVLNSDCAEPEFTVNSYTVDQQSGAFAASLTFVPGVSGAALDAASVSVTQDHETLPSAAWQVSGNNVMVMVPGLSPGIHDIRVMAAGTDGTSARLLLMKAYIGVSTDWRDAILYFVMLDRFKNGDAGNDNPIPGLPALTNYMGGDLQGLMDTLISGYFTDLGVNAIWISWPGDNTEAAEWGSYVNSDDCQIPQGAPGYPRVDVQFSGYHGYWPTHMRSVEEHFGDMVLLQDVVNVAHSMGIRILLDLPVNHVHENSPFFINHPESYFNLDPVEICEEINWIHPETCWFTEFLPDIRYQDLRAVRDFLRAAAWWVEQTGCDGFRVDALKHVAFNFIGALRSEMTQRFEQTGNTFFLLGETFSGDPNEVAAYIGDDLVHGQFDFPLNLNVLKGFATEEIGLDQVYSACRSSKDVYHSAYVNNIMSNFLGNHDIARFLSMAAGDITCGVWDNISHIAQGWRNPPSTPDWDGPYAKLRLAFTYLFTLPDIPLIYYGDEFGLPGANDPDNRRFMKFSGDWNSYQQATFDHISLLSQIRSEHAGLRRPAMGPPLFSDGTFIAYPRLGDGEKIAVVLNRSASPRTQSINVQSLGLTHGDTLTDAISGTVITVTNTTISVTVNGYSGAIYIADSDPSPTPTGNPPPTATPTPPGHPSPTPSPPPGTPPTPSPTTPAGNATIRIFTNQASYSPDAFFRLTREIHNGPAAQTVAVYTLLDVAGYYFFWPGWTQTVDYRTQNLAADHLVSENLLEFTWPAGAGQGNASFWAAMFVPLTWNLVGEPDHCEFIWQ